MRRTLHWLLPLAALILLAVVGHDFASTWLERGRRQSQPLPVLPRDVLAQAQRWRWSQTTGDAARIEVSADDFAQSASGARADLEGVVLRIHRDGQAGSDRVESDAMRLLGSGELYSEGPTAIALGVPGSGGGPPDAIIETSGVTFRPAESSARTDRPLRYRFEGGSGRSVGAVYDARDGTLELVSDVRIEREPADRGGIPARVAAGSLQYLEQGGRIELAGGARIERGALWLESQSAVLSLEAGQLRTLVGVAARAGEDGRDRSSRFWGATVLAHFDDQGALIRAEGRGGADFESREAGQRLSVRSGILELGFESEAEASSNPLRWVLARENATATLISADSGLTTALESAALRLTAYPESGNSQRVETLGRGTLRQSAGGGGGPPRTLRANSIELELSDGSQLRSLRADGAVELEQRSGGNDSDTLRTWSDRLQAELDPKTGEMASLRQEGAFRFQERDSRGTASRARFATSGAALELEGGAAVRSAGTSLEASRISVNRATGRVEAQGAVTGSMARSGPADAGAQAGGLFSEEAPVFIAAGRMASDPDSRRAEYEGAARLWQAGNRLDADGIEIDRGAGLVVALGNVTLEWEDASAEGDAPGSLTRVRADRMVYAEATGEAKFTGSVEFQRHTMRIRADVLTATVAAGGQGGTQAVAEGAVRVADPPDGTGQRGFGDRAEFSAARSEIVLTGTPARLVAADGTRSEAASLTYRASDASLLLLGRGDDRALTQRPAP